MTAAFRPTLPAEVTAPLAARITAARRARLFTRRALAHEARLRPSTVRRLESCERGLSAAIVGRIAAALGIDEAELYPGGRPDAFWTRIADQMRAAHAPVAAQPFLARAA